MPIIAMNVSGVTVTNRNQHTPTIANRIELRIETGSSVDSNSAAITR